MTVRSKQLVGTVNLTTASQSLYTVQSGETTLVKYVVVYNRHATNAATITLGRGSSAGNTNNGTFLRESIGPFEAKRWDVWLALPAGAQISAIASANTSLSVSLYGAELEGVAD